MLVKKEVLKVGERLKILRERTTLSPDLISKSLGFSSLDGYHYYEAHYDEEFLPYDLVRALIPLFRPYGISCYELFALAGVSDENANESCLVEDGLIDTPLYKKTILKVKTMLEENPAYYRVEESAVDVIVPQLYRISSQTKVDVMDESFIQCVIELMQENRKI